MLYLLTPAMYPRFLITLDERLENYPVTVRVGQVSFFPLVHFIYFRGVDTLSFNRPLTLLVRLGSQERYLGSRRINHRCDLGRPSEQNWRPRSTFHLAIYWKGLLYCIRTRVGRRRIRWSCNTRPTSSPSHLTNNTNDFNLLSLLGSVSNINNACSELATFLVSQAVRFDHLSVWAFLIT